MTLTKMMVRMIAVFATSPRKPEIMPAIKSMITNGLLKWARNSFNTECLCSRANSFLPYVSSRSVACSELRPCCVVLRRLRISSIGNVTSSSLVIGGFMVATGDSLELLVLLTNFAINPAPLKLRENHVSLKGVSEGQLLVSPKIERER